MPDNRSRWTIIDRLHVQVCFHCGYCYWMGQNPAMSAKHSFVLNGWQTMTEDIRTVKTELSLHAR